MIRKLAAQAAIAGVTGLGKGTYNKIKEKVNESKDVNKKLEQIQNSLEEMKSDSVSREEYEAVCQELAVAKDICINIVSSIKTMETHDFWETMDTVDGHKSYILGKYVGMAEEFLKKDKAREEAKKKQEQSKRQERVSNWMASSNSMSEDWEKEDRHENAKSDPCVVG